MSIIKYILQRPHFLHLFSIICGIHCILTPIFILGIPYLGQYLHNPILEIALLSVSLFFGSLVIYQGYSSHENKLILLLYVKGVLFLFVHFIMDLFHFEYLNFFILSLGNILMGTSYYLNWRIMRRRCASCASVSQKQFIKKI